MNRARLRELILDGANPADVPSVHLIDDMSDDDVDALLANFTRPPEDSGDESSGDDGELPLPEALERARNLTHQQRDELEQVAGALGVPRPDDLDFPRLQQIVLKELKRRDAASFRWPDRDEWWTYLGRGFGPTETRARRIGPQPGDAWSVPQLKQAIEALPVGTRLRSSGGRHASSEVARPDGTPRPGQPPSTWVDTTSVLHLDDSAPSSESATWTSPFDLPIRADSTYVFRGQQVQAVRVPAGVRLRTLNTWLHGRGHGLEILGSYDGQALFGAITTGTHGSSWRHGPMCDEVISIDLLSVARVPGRSTWKVRQIRVERTGGPSTSPGPAANQPGWDLIQDDDLFRAVVVGMGCFGIAVALTVRVVPAFRLRETRQPIEWKADTAGLASDAANHPNDYAEFLVTPYRKPAQPFLVLRTLRQRTDEPDTIPPHEPLPGRVPEALTTARTHGPTWPTGALSAMLGPVRADCAIRATRHGGLVATSHRVFKLDAGSYVTAGSVEIAVPAHRLGEALDILHRMVDQADAQVWSPFGVRFVRTTDAWLAPQARHGWRDGEVDHVAMIEIPLPVHARPWWWNRDKALLAMLASTMVDRLGARLHWGQWHQLGFLPVRRLYGAEACRRWQEARARIDPEGAFHNAWSELLERQMTVAADVVLEPLPKRSFVTTTPAPTQDVLDADVLIVGTGFGGSVAALRLASQGRAVTMLERGANWSNHADLAPWQRRPPHGRDSWPSMKDYDRRAGFGATRHPVIPGAPRSATGSVPGLIERFSAAAPHSDPMDIIAGACVGGGSVVYGGMMVRPPSWLHRRMFQVGPSAADLDEPYRTVQTTIGFERDPAEWHARLHGLNPYIEHVRFRDLVRNAKVQPETLASAFDWQAIYASMSAWLRGDQGFIDQAKTQWPLWNMAPIPRAARGDYLLADPGPFKLSLDRTYLPAAQATGRCTIHQLVRVRRFRRDGSRWRVTAEVLDDHARTEREVIFRANDLFLCAGSLGTTRLLLEGLHGPDPVDELQPLRPHIGEGWGNNGDALFLANHPHFDAEQGGPPSIAVPPQESDAGRPHRLVYTPGYAYVAGFAPLLAMYIPTEPSSLAWDAGRRDVHTRFHHRGDKAQLAAIQQRTQKLLGVPIYPQLSRNPYYTYHPLGGAVMGRVTDELGQVRGAPNLYVLDGSLLPGHTATANPSWTIAALAEHCVSRLIHERGLGQRPT